MGLSVRPHHHQSGGVMFSKLNLALGAIAIAGLIMGAGGLYTKGRSDGRAIERAAIAEATARRLKDASAADDAHNRCLANPACRLSDDGFRRD